MRRNRILQSLANFPRADLQARAPGQGNAALGADVSEVQNRNLQKMANRLGDIIIRPCYDNHILL